MMKMSKAGYNEREVDLTYAHVATAVARVLLQIYHAITDAQGFVSDRI